MSNAQPSRQPPELWDSADIAAYLRLSRKSVQNRLITEPDFPEPVRGCGRPLLWVRDDVLDFILDKKQSR